MFKAKIEKVLIKAVVDLGFIRPTDTVISISEKSQFGDYSSNIALQVSKQKHQNRYQNPVEIANAIIEQIGHPKFLERIEVAGAGFINFFIKDSDLAAIVRDLKQSLPAEAGRGELGDPTAGGGEESSEKRADEKTSEKRIIVEYCEPNTHKMLHIGHLLQLTLGEAMSRLYEYQGNEVLRTNYGSDIGLTIAKCIWAIRKMGDIGEIRGKSLREKAEYLGKAYALGHSEYEKSLEVKEEIDQITNRLYQRDPELASIWEETREWSLGYFDTIYSIFGTLFDRRINESEVDQIGKEIVLENVGKVFVKDAGAIIYPGEKHGLHNRVFINGKGNPTYEGKDVGLAEKYIQLYQFDELNIYSHKEQDDYFKVVIQVNGEIFPNLKGKIHHISYGEVKLSTGKMSSRTGNVVAAEDIFDQAKEKIREISPQLDSLSLTKLAVGAIKFAFLKYSVSSDIIYDIEESVSIHGDTGPYVMYVYARIMSMLRKATGNRAKENEASDEDEEAQEGEIAQKSQQSVVSNLPAGKAGQSSAKNKKAESLPVRQAGRELKADSLEIEEREILRQLEYFEFIVKKATDNFQPNEITKYLLNLTKAFNLFYEKLPVIGSKQEEFRLMLSKRAAENIKLGLYLLGIETVDKM